MISFDKDQNLGKTISKWTTFSEIGNRPITDKKQLTIAGGRHKMSRLCGFVFTAKDGEQFAMAYVCKLRSKINRQQKKQVGGQWTIPSRWFFLTRSSNDQLNVFSKSNAMVEYNFDVNKFFKSDLFAKEVPKLQKKVQSGMKQARQFAESLKNSDDKRLAIEEVSSIELSIPLMIEDRFEDKNYPLINYEIKEEEMKEKELDEARQIIQNWLHNDQITIGDLTYLIERYMKKNPNYKKQQYRTNIEDMPIMFAVTNGKAGKIVNAEFDPETESITLFDDQRESLKFASWNRNAKFESEKKLDEASFDQYEWNDGSLTGNGLIKMIQDSGKGKQNTLSAPVRIYDRATNKYYDIVDSHLGKKNAGFMIEIDTSKDASAMKENDEAIDEADERDPVAHELDIIGIKHSTATTADQDAAAISMVEDEIDAEIEEAMKKIYK